MIANSLLVRWAFGWYELAGDYTPQTWAPAPWEPTDAPWRREALLSLGAVQSDAEVVRIGREQLGWYGNPRTAITADLAPTGDADTPYEAFGVGDTVTVPALDGTPVQERVIGLTVSEDEYGTVTFAPELKDLVLSDYERWQTNLDKLANGSVGGNSTAATPAADTTGLGKDCCPPKPRGWTVTTGTDNADSYSATSQTWVADVETSAYRLSVSGTPVFAGTTAPVSFALADGTVLATVDLNAGSPQTLDVSIPIHNGGEYRFDFEPAPVDDTYQGIRNLAITLDVAGAHPDVEVGWTTPL